MVTIINQYLFKFTCLITRFCVHPYYMILLLSSRLDCLPLEVYPSAFHSPKVVNPPTFELKNVSISSSLLDENLIRKRILAWYSQNSKISFYYLLAYIVVVNSGFYSSLDILSFFSDFFEYLFLFLKSWNFKKICPNVAVFVYSFRNDYAS